MQGSRPLHAARRFYWNAAETLRVSPDFARGVHHELKFLPLLVHGKQVAGGHGCEAALRAERQVFQRHELGSLVDPPPQFILRFQFRLFRRDQAEHDAFPLWNQAQRLEPAATLGVIFEKKPIHLQNAQKAFPRWRRSLPP